MPRTTESKYGCSDEPAQVGIICLKDANYADRKYYFPPDPGYHWDPAKIAFHELAGFGRTGGISYSINDGVIVVGAWVRSDPPNKAKASLAAYEFRNDPTATFTQLVEGTLRPSNDLVVPLRGAKDWQVQIDFPPTDQQPGRQSIVTSESPDRLAPYLRIEQLSNGQIILRTTSQSLPLQ